MDYKYLKTENLKKIVWNLVNSVIVKLTTILRKESIKPHTMDNILDIDGYVNPPSPTNPLLQPGNLPDSTILLTEKCKRSLEEIFKIQPILDLMVSSDEAKEAVCHLFENCSNGLLMEEFNNYIIDKYENYGALKINTSMEIQSAEISQDIVRNLSESSRIGGKITILGKTIFDFKLGLDQLAGNRIPIVVLDNDTLDRFLSESEKLEFAKRPMKRLEYSITLNSIEYILSSIIVEMKYSNKFIIFPKHMTIKKRFKTSKIIPKTKSLYIYGQSLNISYFSYKINADNVIEHKPHYIESRSKYPIFIYYTAFVIYSISDKSQKAACADVELAFGLDMLSRSALSHFCAKYDDKLGIRYYNLLTDEQKQRHDELLEELHLKNNPSDREFSHTKYRKYYRSCVLSNEFNLDWFTHPKSINLPSDWESQNLIKINPAMFVHPSETDGGRHKPLRKSLSCQEQTTDFKT